MLVNDGLSVLVSEMPWLVVFRIVPPLLAPPVPVTVRLPDDPVLLSTMPLAGPLAPVPTEMLRKRRPVSEPPLPAPIVVLVTLRAVPVVVVIVLAAPITRSVPPVLAANAALVPV